MGPQFIHIEAYGRNASIKAKGKTTIRGVIGEATREEGFISHLENPQKPVFLLGTETDLRQLEQDIDTAAEKGKDARGHTIRKDANLLIAGVASFAKPELSWTGDDSQSYELWKTLTVDFLKNKFGNGLQAIVEHRDEAYPHVHFYVANKTDLVQTKDLHPGFAAKIGVPKSEANLKYIEAMRSFQDSFYETVAAPVGLTRLGPKVQRLNRQQWKAQKHQAGLFSDIQRKLDEEGEVYESKMADLRKQQNEITKKVEEIAGQRVARFRESFEFALDTLESKVVELEGLREQALQNYPNKTNTINIELREEPSSVKSGTIIETGRKLAGRMVLTPPKPTRIQ